MRQITINKITRTAARAMAPGVTSRSPHLVPVDLGPERVLLSPSDVGPNNMTFSTYDLSVRYIATVSKENRVPWPTLGSSIGPSSSRTYRGRRLEGRIRTSYLPGSILLPEASEALWRILCRTSNGTRSVWSRGRRSWRRCSEGDLHETIGWTSSKCWSGGSSRLFISTEKI